MIRDILREAIKKTIGEEKEIGLLLSGGLDSLSVLLGCLDLGIKPRCYTFYLSNHESDDLKSVRKLKKIYDLDVVEICLNVDKINVFEDVKKIVDMHRNDEYAKKHKKAFIQCFHPMMYIAPVVKEKIVLTAFVADELQFAGRRRSILGQDTTPEGVERLLKHRLDEINEPCNGGMKEIIDFFAKYDSHLVDIYHVDEVVEFFLTKGYKECTSPKEKNIIYEAYKEELDKHKTKRLHSSYQVNSFIREWHDDKLLNDESINYNNNKSVVAIYNRLFRRNACYKYSALLRE